MADEFKANVLAACRLLLRPLARLLIRSGVPWKEFAALSKRSFVEVATREFGIRGRPTNVARVSILTGINRREVARLRDVLDEGEPSAPEYVNSAQRVLSGWYQDPDYSTSEGEPRVLAADGPAPSFADLCARYGGDVPPTSLLKELRAAGNVAAAGDGALRVLSRVYIPLKVDPQKALRAGSVLADVGETVVHDLTCGPDDVLRFERRAENSRIDPRHLPAFREFLEKEGQAFLVRVDDWLTAHETPSDPPSARPRLRLGVGVYHIQTNEDSGAKK
jgi:hypothetical protein